MALGMILENGWPECDLVDCDYATIPGTALRLPFQKCAPFIILQAFLRDLDQYIEPVMNARGITDEGSWTEDNSVYTSNHKGATAFDYNWDDHPMGRAGAGWDGSVLIDGDQVPAVQELLAWYEGMVFWGNNWNTPKDSMHFQMGYDTYGPANAARVQNFIDRKLRADGYSTWRRGGTARGGGVTPPVAVPVQTGLTANLLQSIGGYRKDMTLARYQALLPELIDAFHFADVNTIDRRAMGIAQLFHESGSLHYQEEIADGSAYEGRIDLGNTQPGDGKRFKGRDFLQVTGRSNYTKLSAWAFARKIPGVDSPTFFVDHPEKLGTDQFAFLGFAWYWTTRRNQAGQSLNDMADARNIDGATYMVNGGYNGLDSRKAFYAKALAANADLLDPTPTDPLEELLMLEVHSWSIYAKPGEGKIPVYQLIQALDAHGPHEPYWEQRARAGDTAAIQDLARVAANGPWNFDLNRYVDDPGAKRQALGVLLEIQAAHPEWITAATPGKA